MSLFFPDVNVWLALSVADHSHHQSARRWLRDVGADAKLLASRFTQLALLRLLTNVSVMGEQTLTIHRAWAVHDRWLQDPRVEFRPESRGVEFRFRTLTESLRDVQAPKWIGDCYILACSKESGAALVTFDPALHALARKNGYASILPV